MRLMGECRSRSEQGEGRHRPDHSEDGAADGTMRPGPGGVCSGTCAAFGDEAACCMLLGRVGMGGFLGTAQVIRRLRLCAKWDRVNV
jgi:hypothetical protein